MMNVSTPGSTAVSGAATLSSTRSALMGDMPQSDNQLPINSTTGNKPMTSSPLVSDTVPTPTQDPVTDTSGGYGGVPPHFVPAGGNLATPPDDDQGLKTPMRKKSKLIPALAGLAMLLAVVGGGAALYLSQQQQDLRQKAAEDTNITCTGVELRKMEAGQDANDPSKWTLVSGKTMTITEGTQIAYKPSGCTAGWVAGIRWSYDARDFFTPGTSEWCASNGDYCKVTPIFKGSPTTLYVRSNLKKTFNGTDYWCKHNNNWAQKPAGSTEPNEEDAAGPAGYTCNMSPAAAEVTVQDNGTATKCYSVKDACTSYNANNCADSTGVTSDLNQCLSSAGAAACNTKSNLNYVSIVSLNAKGNYVTRNGKGYYESTFRAFRSLPAVKSFTYAAVTYQCLSGPHGIHQDRGECDQNQMNVSPVTLEFGSNPYVDFKVEREVTMQCGALQIDPYLIDITIDQSTKVVCKDNVVGATYAVCNVVSNQGSQLCEGLPESWTNICPNATSTPTPTTTAACPTSSYINIASATVTKNAQQQLVVGWLKPTIAPNVTPSPEVKYIVNRVKQPIVDAGPTPTWSPTEDLIGPAPASDARFVKTGNNISITDTANAATCGFVYRYSVRAYNTTSWDSGRDSRCNVLVTAELSVPCEGTATPTPSGTLTPTPTSGLTATPTLTPTPTGTIGCNSTCSDDDQCKVANSNYVCSIEDGNRCRLEGNRSNSSCEGPGATNTPTPIPAIGCNDSCVTNADCSNTEHICYQTSSGAKVCRLDANPDSTSCTRAVAQTQPTLPPALPKTGPEDWALWLKAGLVTLGLGAGLLLLL